MNKLLCKLNYMYKQNLKKEKTYFGYVFVCLECKTLRDVTKFKHQIEAPFACGFL